MDEADVIIEELDGYNYENEQDLINRLKELVSKSDLGEVCNLLKELQNRNERRVGQP
jgi:hypothetical protein